MKTHPIATPHPIWEMCRKHWDLPETLYAGKHALLKRRKEYIPKFDAETEDAYQARIARALLDNVYRKAIERVVSLPFAKDASIRGGGSQDDPTKKSDRLSAFRWDVDGTGIPITGFLAEVLRVANRFGGCHVLLDYPALQPGATLADEIAAGGRPFAHVIEPDRLFGWSWGDDGQLDHIRYTEWGHRSNGYTVESVERIRLITRTEWQLWEKREADVTGQGPEWVLIDEGLHTFGAVPLLTYTIRANRRLDRFAFLPPHETLADLNLAHWQSTSDQRHITHFARVPLLYATGVTEEDVANLVIKAGGIIPLMDPQAKVGYIEHGGKAIEAGMVEIERLEDRMRSLSLQPFQPRAGVETKATTVATENQSQQSEVQRWIRDLEAFAVRIVEQAAAIIGEQVPDDIEVDIYSDFTVQLHDAADLKWLDEARKRGDIDQITYLVELRRRGVLDETADPEQIKENTEAEGLDSVPPGDPPRTDDPGDDPDAGDPNSEDDDDPLDE